MGLPIGSIVEATYRSTLLGQRILNVYHYQVTTSSSLTNIADEMNKFLDQFVALTDDSMLKTFTDAIPSNMTVNEAVAQPVKPIRYIRVNRNVNIFGARGAATTPNLQGTITFRTALAGRRYVGRKSVPLAASDVIDGLLSVTQANALEVHGSAALLNIIAALGGGVYDPVLPHFSVPNTLPTRLQQSLAQPQVRVQRRRTVGLGE